MMKHITFERIVVLVVVLAFAATGVFFWYWNNKLTQPDTVTTSASASASEEDTASEEASVEATVEVNMGTGGGVIPLDENGDYVGGTGEDTTESTPESAEATAEPESVSEEPTPSASSTAESSTATQKSTGGSVAGKSYSSFDEIDTSTFNIGDWVYVNGVEYTWFGEIAGTDNGFVESTPGGTHIVADYHLSGNIIGH
jgi:hypothetical protein